VPLLRSSELRSDISEDTTNTTRTTKCIQGNDKHNRYQRNNQGIFNHALSRFALGEAAANQNARDKALFVTNDQPDAIIAIFNSPFGPDALVVTDKLSEGVDLHRYCRHLIHYELDPSPIRTVQRNGRIRRVGSWAAITGEPNRYAYPYFAGTRDEQLVRNMKKRIECFSLLLGGVPDIAMDKIGDRDEDWRKRVVDRVKDELKKAGNLLCKRR